MGHSTPVASLRYLKASELRDQMISDAIAYRIGTRLAPGG